MRMRLVPIGPMWKIQPAKFTDGLVLGCREKKDTWDAAKIFGHWVRRGSSSHFDSVRMLVSTQSNLVSGTKDLDLISSPLSTSNLASWTPRLLLSLLHLISYIECFRAKHFTLSYLPPNYSPPPFFCLLGLHNTQHMEVPREGVKSEL